LYPFIISIFEIVYNKKFVINHLSLRALCNYFAYKPIKAGYSALYAITSNPAINTFFVFSTNKIQ